jgi:hypothetical protein
METGQRRGRKDWRGRKPESWETQRDRARTRRQPRRTPLVAQNPTGMQRQPPPRTDRGPPQHVCCTLWVPDSLVGHLVSQVGRGLKLAATISKARIAVSGPSTEPGTARKATIHGTSKEVGMALVVMGKQIAQQRVPNPRSKPKPKKPTPTTSLTAAEERPPPSLQPPPAIGWDPPTAADFAAGREAARVAALLTWPPNGIPSYAPRTPPTPSAWDGEPAAHRKGAALQQPTGTTE